MSGWASGSLSANIIKLALGAIALSMMVITASICLVAGFKEEIKDKVSGFAAHIQLKYTDTQNTFESLPVQAKKSFLDSLQKIAGVRHVSAVITKPALLRGKEDLEGVVMKGINQGFDPDYFKHYLVDGRQIHFHKSDTGREAIISSTTAQRMHLKPGDKLRVYFAGKEIKGRAFRIAGIYETGLEDLDKTIIYCDIRSLKDLNQWQEDEYSSIEISLTNESLIVPLTEKLHRHIPIDWSAMNMMESHPEIFDWLAIVEKNEWVILGIMGTITLITLITCLLVILIERTPMIGTLKSFGAKNGLIRTTFLWIGARLFLIGVLGGTLLGLLLCWGQLEFHWITLDQGSYFMKHLPVKFPWSLILGVVITSLVTGIIALSIPLALINRISPLKAIRFR